MSFPLDNELDTCDYHDDYDTFDRPCGNRCGKPATQVIRWRDGQWSRGCDEHAAEIFRTVPELVRSIEPISIGANHP